ncbi:hypothetical protein IPdc08_01627 [archaeon]|nr:hypothetical protein IPdc08_01627 [archaeon]
MRLVRYSKVECGWGYYCGLILDRHVNAAINILHRGLKKVGLGYTDFMPVRDSVDDTPMTQEVHDFSRG